MTEVFNTDRWVRLLGALGSAFVLLVLAACGGGGTGSTSPNTPTGSLAASPSTIAIEYGAAPVTIVVSGGVKPYALTSSLPALIPVTNSIAEDGRFSIAPAYAPDIPTLVTLTIRDAAQSTTTVQVTVGLPSLPLAVSPAAITVGANTPVTFVITGGVAPYTVISSQPTIVPNPTGVDAQGRFTLHAILTPPQATPVVITIRDARGAVVTATMTVTPVTPIPLIALPTSLTVYANQPGTLTILGGTPPYQAFTSNPTVLPVTRIVVGDQVVLAPANVDSDTTVTITIVDASNASVTSTVLVKPAPLLNTLTVTPTPASPGTGCGTAVCAGQTASATVTVKNAAGAGIQGRAVRFENVQGNYQFITSGPGLPETLANSITVTSDQAGQAIVRLRADVNAPTQVALIRATELTSGNVLNSSFVIAQFTDGAGTLTAIPTTWTLTGPDAANCAANTPVTYYIFGGTPPYRIQSTLPGFVNIVPTIVQTNGGGFTAIVTGTICSPSPGTQITITDATGRTISVTLINARGTGNPATNFHSISFVPGDVTTPLGCGQSIIEQIVGGEIILADGTVQQPTFTVSTLGPNVTATVSGRSITITRTNSGTATSPAIVYVSNSVTTEQLSIAVAQNCGGTTTPPEVMQFNPPSPLVVACAVGSSAQTTITPVSTSAGTVTYTAAPAFGGLSTSIAGNVLTITRTSAVTAGSSSLPVVVSGTAGTSTITGTLYVAPPTTCAP